MASKRKRIVLTVEDRVKCSRLSEQRCQVGVIPKSEIFFLTRLLGVASPPRFLGGSGFFQLLTVNSAILAYFYLETAISLHYKTLIWHFSTQGHFIYQAKYLTEHNE